MDNTPLVFDELLARCMGEIDFAHSLLENFLNSCDDQINEISNSVESGSQDDLARQAHRFKGTAATLAAGPLRDVLAEIELLARQHPEPDAELELLLKQLVVNAQEEIGRLHEFRATSIECP